MRQRAIISLLGLAGLALAGCTTSPTPEGVLPRTTVPPPPSIGGTKPSSTAAQASAGEQTQRRGLSVPGRLATPRS